MHEIVRTRVERNADYHSAMADHFTTLQEAKKNQEEGNGNGKRATLTDTHQMAKITASAEDLAKLIEMHAGAAKQLQELLANEKPQTILAERDKPPVVRKVGAVGMPVRIGGRPRMH
jgi:hypothetical protein